MRLVVIEHPYFTKPDGTRCSAAEIASNHQYMIECIRDCLRRGEQPYLSIPIFALTGALDDTDPHERELGIQAGLAWGAKADTTAAYVDHGITSGMRKGIKRAEKDGRPVEMRRIER